MAKKYIFIITVFLIFFFILFKNISIDNAIADSDFNQMKQIAKEFCENNLESDPKCFENFQKLKNKQILAQSSMGTSGLYESEIFDLNTFLHSWNFNDLPQEDRNKYYKESLLKDGSTLREYWIYAEDKDIEIAPNVFFPAWTYNGQVPAPTIRATEGDLIRVHFTNKGSKPHTMHFHGFHDSKNDGSMPEDFVYPGQNFTYEFMADPFGIHLYHCHATPLKQHISKGMYGAYIVDPKNDTRPKPEKEMVMVMNAFDTDLDGENEVYAINSKAFYYALNPIKVKKGELVRIYLINLVEFDPVNSFHLHANFFDVYNTGTKLEPNAYTDIVSFVQGERSILDIRFKYEGMYMFHAHVSEFTELGWTGFFDVEG